MQPELSSAASAEQPPSVFKNRNYLSLLLAQFVSNIGDYMHGLALIWLMNLLTDGSAFWMSMIAVAQVIPRVVLAPFAGVLVDRWPKLRTMRLVDLTSLVLASVIAGCAFAGVLSPVGLLALTFLLATASNFFNPAKQVLLTQLVSREQLLSANSVSQSVSTICMLGGPVLAGVLIAAVGPYLVFVIDAATFLLSFLFLAFVKHREPLQEMAPLDRRQFMTELGDGFQTVKNIGVVRALIPFGLFINFLYAPMSVYITKLVTDVYHGGAQELGYFEASFGIGMLVGTILLGVVAKKVPKNVLLYTGLFGMAFATFGIALSQSLWLGLIACVFNGIFNIFTNVTLQTAIQTAVPQDKLARVFSFVGMGMQASQPLSNFFFGSILHLFAIDKLLVIVSTLFMGANVAALKPKAIRQLR